MPSFTKKEIEDFLNQSSCKEAFKAKPHQFTTTHAGKSCCRCCGLLALNNRATDWCIQKGCNFTDHPEYKNAMKRLNKTT